MAASLGKNTGTLKGENRGSVPGQKAGSLLGKNPENTSDLPRLGRNDLLKAVQSIVLHFPIKKAAELQDNTTKAVEGQRAGGSAMELLAAANMCRSSAKARALFAPLFGFSGAYTDPDFMEGMERLAMSYLRQQLHGASEAPAMGVSSEDAGEDVDVLTGDLFEARGNA